MQNFYVNNQDYLFKTVEVEAFRLVHHPDSRLEVEWFSLAVIPDIAERTVVAIELLTLREYSGGPDKHMQQLKSILRAVMPMLLEYRTALLDLDGSFKSSADRRFVVEKIFKANWLRHRMHDAARLASTVPMEKMDQVVAGFKPLNAATIEQLLDMEDGAYALKLIPEPERTQAQCLKAVGTTQTALSLVPGQFRDRDMCMLAISAKGQFSGVGLEHVPMVHRDLALCHVAVTNKGRSLEFVPKDLLTVDLCAVACTQNPLAITYVPRELRQPEVMFALAIHGHLEQSSGRIYDDLYKTEPKRAECMYEKFTALHNELHFPNASQSELEDIGLAMALAG